MIVSYLNSKKSFTLLELLIIIAVFGIILVFALPNYSEALRKARERDAIVQLTALHGATIIYRARNKQYLVAPSPGINISQINTQLGINLVANDVDYNYISEDGSNFIANASWNGSVSSEDFTIRITDDSIINMVNPCCDLSTAGQCPSLPDC